VRAPIRRPLAVVVAGICAAVVVPLALATITSATPAQSAAVATGTLGTPGGLGVAWGTCVANTSFQMNLTWTAATNAKGYRILRGSATGGPYTQIGTSIGTSYTDSGAQVGPPILTWNTTYFYVVQATAGAWVSGNSGQASMRTPKKANCT
jgi:hypothetical protein